MTETQRQKLLSSGTKYIILDENKKRYNRDDKGNVKVPNTPYYVVDLRTLELSQIDKTIIKK